MMIEHAIIASLLLAICLMSHSRGYWKGVADEREDSGWEDEAQWWREQHRQSRKQEPNQ